MMIEVNVYEGANELIQSKVFENLADACKWIALMGMTGVHYSIKVKR